MLTGVVAVKVLKKYPVGRWATALKAHAQSRTKKKARRAAFTAEATLRSPWGRRHADSIFARQAAAHDQREHGLLAGYFGRRDGERKLGGGGGEPGWGPIEFTKGTRLKGARAGRQACHVLRGAGGRPEASQILSHLLAGHRRFTHSPIPRVAKSLRGRFLRIAHRLNRIVLRPSANELTKVLSDLR